MTKPTGGEVVEAAAHPDLLAPGTVRRPEWIRPEDWARMPWPAKWRASRRFAEAPVETEEFDDAPLPLPAVVEQAPRHRGPIPVQPHGTYAAARRHERRGERPCPPCAEARLAYTRRTGATARPPRSSDVDHVLVERFILGDAAWTALSVPERILAARRLDAAGVSRRVIRERTHLNTRTIRGAWIEDTP